MSASQSSIDPAPSSSPAAGHGEGNLLKLMMGAVGVVYGDIGTSPLYALRESFAGHHPLPLDSPHILGVLSIIFWSMLMVVTVKYVTFTLRADNQGEGGSLALLALISSKLKASRWSSSLIILGVFATALFYGDSVLTPAISVLSAVEGLRIINPGFGHFVVPLAIAILVALFMIQSRGTAVMGTLFGPITIVYFIVLAVLGIVNLVNMPQVLLAINPLYGLNFFLIDPKTGFLALGSVVLAITGAEALYADMGHFGRRPIRLSWLWLVMPALILNYFGQGALLLANPATIANPFYLMAPEWALVPLVVLATMATVIASQAVISGAYSVTLQAIQLGFLPRLSILHTSEHAKGQVYIPFINWALMVGVLGLVVSLKSSSNLAAAYGVAVTGTMIISTILLGVVMFGLWRWHWLPATLMLTVFFIVDIAYFAANLVKVPDGGWIPLVIGLVLLTLMTTWSRGRKLVRAKLRESAMPIALFIRAACGSAIRAPGTAVFLTSASDGVPPALLHNMKHNKVLHERVVFLTVRVDNVPYTPDADRVCVESLGDGFYRVVMRFGFMQETDVPRTLKLAEAQGLTFKLMETSFFLARQTLIPSPKPGMAIWREKLFAWMVRNAATAMEFFKLPTNRVVELGSQVEI